MDYIVRHGHISCSVEEGAEIKSIGQLTTDQMMEYLQDCADWNDLLVAPLFHELCERLDMDFDEYETYDELYCEVDNKLNEIIEKQARYDFIFKDEENRPMTQEKALDRLIKYRKEDPAVPIWPDAYAIEYNSQLNIYMRRNEK